MLRTNHSVSTPYNMFRALYRVPTTSTTAFYYCFLALCATSYSGSVYAQAIATSVASARVAPPAQSLIPPPDSLLKLSQLTDVVVTATRREQLAGAATLPVTVISQQQLRAAGTMRLSDVLTEQTGLALTTFRNTGVQMQGLDPDYTLILVDGEPIIGRIAGAIDLSRLAMGNVKQVEILKGPASSLYGSDALAGVINIITRSPDDATRHPLSGQIGLRYGTFNTFDANADAQYKSSGKGKLGVSVALNHYRTDGYDLAFAAFGKTVEPYYSTTVQSRITYEITPRTRVSLSLRYYNELQQNAFDTGTPASPEFVVGTGTVNDANATLLLSHRFSEALKLSLRLYGTQYSTRDLLNYQQSGTAYSDEYFGQTFLRQELVAEYQPAAKHTLLFGGGLAEEQVNSTRYTDTKTSNDRYAFVQYEYNPTRALKLIGGGRLDVPSAYATQFSPKISARYAISRVFAVRASAGVGFKSPDFRQLYLNFSNAVAGYSVFGVDALASGYAALKAANQIAETYADPAQFRLLQPERSVAYNLGLQIQPSERLVGNIGLFRNDLDNLIETTIVARKTNEASVYTYHNINQALTEGIETDWQYRISKTLQIAGGYQFLIAVDKAVVAKIEAGEVYMRDPLTLESQKLKPSDYKGLFERSPHAANLKLWYENPATGISASLRAIYRGDYGYADRNSNGIYDRNDETVRGYTTFNLALAKTFATRYTIQAGCDNILNYTDAPHIPTLPGRLLWVKCSVRLNAEK